MAKGIYQKLSEYSRSYLRKRSALFNKHSQFRGCESCNGICCSHPKLGVSVTLTDLIMLSMATKRSIVDLALNECEFTFELQSEEYPTKWRMLLALKKPCPFLRNGKCTVYCISSTPYVGRPLACAIFPEAEFCMGDEEWTKERQRYFPCGTNIILSSERKEIIKEMSRLIVIELAVFDLYIFGKTPHLFDFAERFQKFAQEHPELSKIEETVKGMTDLTEYVRFRNFCPDGEGIEYPKFVKRIFHIIYPSQAEDHQIYRENLEHLDKYPDIAAIWVAAIERHVSELHFEQSPPWELQFSQVKDWIRELQRS